MDIELSDWAQTRIEALLASGRASCAREAIDFAFAAWDAHERETEALLEGQSDEWWAELNRSLDVACAELDEGKGIPLTPELIEGIKRRGREQLLAKPHRTA